MYIVISDGRVRGDAVIPQRDGALFPFDADWEVLAEGDVLVLLVRYGDRNE